jgi:hypothetical protein
MKKHSKHVVLALLFGGVVYAAEKPSVDSSIVVVSIQSEIKARPSAVLSIVKKAVKLHPSWSGEIVKAAIRASKADIQLVASIVETAVIAAPEHARLIAQCATAVAPDALDAVREVLAKLGPKPAATDALVNSLDFPTNGQVVSVGAAAGQNPALAYVPWILQYQLCFVTPKPVTNNNLPD